MSEHDALHDAFEAEFDDAEFPVSNPMALAPHLSNGPATQFEGDEVTVSAMDLLSISEDHSEDAPNEGFPYEDDEELIEDILYGLEADGILPADE